MRTIVAIKNGRKKTFTERSWELLGPKKEGYVALPDVEITNIVQQVKPGTKANTKNKPATGEQKIHNTTGQQPSQTITNTTPATGENNTPAPGGEVDVEKKEAFLQAAKGVTGGVIKDYFDGCTPKIKYKKSATPDELVEQLGEVLSWDVVEFQKLFS